MRTALALSLAVLLAAPARAQFGAGGNDSGGPLHPEQAAFDVQRYALDLAVDPAAKRIGGSLTMDALIVAPASVLRLDLDDALAVSAVVAPACDAEGSCGDAPDVELAWERPPGAVRVHLGRTAQPGELVTVRVDYGGTPREAPRPPWDGGVTWAASADGRPWVAVSCQGEGADLWWPTKDHPSDEPDRGMSIALTAPAGLRAVANGIPVAESATDSTVTEVWEVPVPINGYGVSFGIGPFEEVRATYASPLGYEIPAVFYVLPERRADAERQMPGFLDAMGFLERTFGPYGARGAGYKVVHTPYLGMEHQSLVAYGSDFQDNAYGFDWLHFHELAHEWWANLGTAPDWRDFWIHESFANYAEALYAEDLARRRTGSEAVAQDAYRRYLGTVRGRLQNVLPVAPAEPRTTSQMYNLPGGGFNGDIYFKGSWFLHTLRTAIADDPAFFRALRAILYPQGADVARDPAEDYRWVSTADVMAAFQAETDVDLAPYEAVYLRQPALPVLAISDPGGSGAGYRATWLLPPGALPDGVAFEMPVYANGQPIPMPGGVGEIPGFRSALRIDTTAALFELAPYGRTGE